MQKAQWLRSNVVDDFLNFLTDAWTEGSFSHSWVSRSSHQTGLPAGYCQTVRSVIHALDLFSEHISLAPPARCRTLAGHFQAMQQRQLRVQASLMSAQHQTIAAQQLLEELNHQLMLCGQPKLSRSKSADVISLLPQFCADVITYTNSDQLEPPAAIVQSPWLSAASAPLASLLQRHSLLCDNRITLGMAVLVRNFWTTGTRTLQSLPEQLRFSWTGQASTQNPNFAGQRVFPELASMNFLARLQEQQRLLWLLDAWAERLATRGLLTHHSLLINHPAPCQRYLLSAALYSIGYAAWPVRQVKQPLSGLHKQNLHPQGLRKPQQAPVIFDAKQQGPDNAKLQQFVLEQLQQDADDTAREIWLEQLQAKQVRQGKPVKPSRPEDK